jgi:hypothetical protein
MLLVFVLARDRRSDLVTVLGVAERRTPERSAVKRKDAKTPDQFVQLNGIDGQTGI